MLYASPRAPRLEAHAVTGAAGDYDGLLDLIGGSGVTTSTRRTAGWELGEPPETYPTAL